MATRRTTSYAGVLAAGGVLDEIVAAKAVRLEELKRREPLEQIIQRAAELAKSRKSNSFAESLRKPERINIIAEIKRRSPSKGVIREEFDAAIIAESYELGGAAAISVLAEEDYFGGSLEDVRSVQSRVHLPLLRKDFVFDEYQVYESVLGGADAVLLIVALLDNDLLLRLMELSRSVGLETLVEVHTKEEMERANRARAQVIGINNRDLTNFRVDLNTSIELARLAPSGATLVSESGITCGKDIQMLKRAGFHAFLIGEHFMRADDPGNQLGKLIKEAEALSLSRL